MLGRAARSTYHGPFLNHCGRRLHSSFVGLLRLGKRIVQINFDAQLLRLISQPLNQFGVGKPRNIGLFVAFRPNVEHPTQLLASSELAVQLRHSAAFYVQRYFLNISPYFWWEIAEELGSLFLLRSDIAVSVALDATIFICFL